MADLVLVRNNTYAFDIAVVDNTGVAVNISAASFLCSAKRNYDDDDSIAIFKKTSPSSGIQILNGPSGTLRVTLAASDTSILDHHETKLYYDVKMILSSLPYSIVRGVLTILPNVTDSIS